MSTSQPVALAFRCIATEILSQSQRCIDGFDRALVSLKGFMSSASGKSINDIATRLFVMS
jgi:hypothetical protein